MSFIKTWDETFPSDTQNASLGADDIRNLTYAIRERLAIDHYFLAIEGGDAKIGYHKSGTFIDQTADLLGATGAVRIYGKTVSGKVELFLVMADNTVIQLTVGGKLNTQAMDGILPTANGGTGSSANANAAGGVLVPTGAPNAASGAVVLDANAKLPAVDGSLLTGLAAKNPLGAWNGSSYSDSNSYMASTDGFVSAYNNAQNQTGEIFIYTDASNPPTTLRGYSRASRDSSSMRIGLCIPIRKGDYWKVVGTATPATIHWIPLGA